MVATITELWCTGGLEQLIRGAPAPHDVSRRQKVSAAMTQVHTAAIKDVKNAYNLEFLACSQDSA